MNNQNEEENENFEIRIHRNFFFLIFNVQPKFALPYNNYDNFFF